MKVCDVCQEKANGWLQDLSGDDMDLCKYHVEETKEFLEKLRKEEEENNE